MQRTTATPAEIAAAPCASEWSDGGTHTWLRVYSGPVRPDGTLGCQHCPAEITEAQYAQERGYVVLTKGAPAFRIHAVTHTSTRATVLGEAGTRREAIAKVNRLVDATWPAAAWTADGERCVYAPTETGRREEPAALIP